MKFWFLEIYKLLEVVILLVSKLIDKLQDYKKILIAYLKGANIYIIILINMQVLR